MSESFAELFEQSLAGAEMRPGSIIRGTVVDIGPDVVVVNAGLKSEGVVPKWQFLDADGQIEVQVGDTVECTLELLEDGLGATLLSRDKAKRLKAWTDLEKAHEENETVVGRLTGKVRGGFTVAIGALRAFLPGSLVDVRPVRDTAYLEGKDLEFKVIKIDQKRNNVVLSRRAVVESEFSAEKEALLENLKEGAIVAGVVKNLTDYGAFIDLGGIDGLLHITDMAWKRVRHPSEAVQIPGNPGQGSQVRPGKEPRLPGTQAIGRRSVAQYRPSLPAGYPFVRQGQQPHRLRLLRRVGRRRGRSGACL